MRHHEYNFNDDKIFLFVGIVVGILFVFVAPIIGILILSLCVFYLIFKKNCKPESTQNQYISKSPLDISLPPLSDLSVKPSTQKNKSPKTAPIKPSYEFIGSPQEYFDKYIQILNESGLTSELKQHDFGTYHFLSLDNNNNFPVFHLKPSGRLKYWLIPLPIKEVQTSTDTSLLITSASQTEGTSKTRVFLHCPDDLDAFKPIISQTFLDQQQKFAKYMQRENELRKYKEKLVADQKKYVQSKLLDHYAVVDIETTGLDKYSDRITEIAVVLVENGVIVNRFSTLVNPGVSIPHQITELTGITNSMVKNKPTIDEILPDFMKFVEGYTLIAHNANFDIGFLQLAHTRVFHESFVFSYVDTLDLAKYVIKPSNYKLTTIAKFFDIPTPNSHRALADCETLMQCYEKIKYLAKILY